MKIVVTAILFQVILIQSISAQQMSVADNRNPFIALVEQYFGLDQNLINGTQYYDRYEGCKGVPFFKSIVFMEGGVAQQMQRTSICKAGSLWPVKRILTPARSTIA